jgi:hypothetical protein
MTSFSVASDDDLEIDQFELLKPVLANLWDSVFPGDDEAYTSVIVPSLTLDQVQELGLQVGRALAEGGVIGRFSVDFLATRSVPSEPWTMTAIEINMRMGGTTRCAFSQGVSSIAEPASCRRRTAKPGTTGRRTTCSPINTEGWCRRISSRSSPPTGWTSTIGRARGSCFT